MFMPLAKFIIIVESTKSSSNRLTLKKNVVYTQNELLFSFNHKEVVMHYSIFKAIIKEKKHSMFLIYKSLRQSDYIINKRMIVKRHMEWKMGLVAYS